MLDPGPHHPRRFLRARSERQAPPPNRTTTAQLGERLPPVEQEGQTRDKPREYTRSMNSGDEERTSSLSVVIVLPTLSHEAKAAIKPVGSSPVAWGVRLTIFKGKTEGKASESIMRIFGSA